MTPAEQSTRPHPRGDLERALRRLIHEQPDGDAILAAKWALDDPMASVLDHRAAELLDMFWQQDATKSRSRVKAAARQRPTGQRMTERRAR